MTGSAVVEFALLRSVPKMSTATNSRHASTTELIKLFCKARGTQTDAALRCEVKH